MKSLKEVSIGLLSGIVTSLIVLGAILVSMTEGLVPIMPTAQPTMTLPVFEETPLPGIPTSTPPTQQPTSRPVMVTPTPTFARCAIPQGWVLYMIQPGDKLSDLAAQRGVSVGVLMAGNCLAVSTLLDGTQLVLPPLPTATFTPSVSPSVTFTASFTLRPTLTAVSCGPRPGWVVYIVQPGDNLYRLSLAVHKSVQELEFANCLPDYNIASGQALFLPFIPPRPTLTFTPVPSSTPVRTFTFTPTRTLTLTRTATFTPTNSSTPVTPSATPVTPSPTPVTPSPTPVTPSPTPVTPSPTPVTPSATPVTPSPTPVTPSPTPETPSPTPVTPSPKTVTPSPKTITPLPTPVTPSPTPETPTPTPVTPSPNLMGGLDPIVSSANIGTPAATGTTAILNGTFKPE